MSRVKSTPRRKYPDGRDATYIERLREGIADGEQLDPPPSPLSPLSLPKDERPHRDLLQQDTEDTGQGFAHAALVAAGVHVEDDGAAAVRNDEPERVQEQRITVAASIHEGQTFSDTPGTSGHELHVTVIQGGTSKNGYSYDEAALQTIARLVEGAHAYADHARSTADEGTRSVRDIVGFYHNARYLSPLETGTPGGRVDADLHLFDGASWLWSLIREATEHGRPELVGLSIDILGKWRHDASAKSKTVTQVVALNSCDIVTRPSAGGSVRRILHHDDRAADQQETTPAQAGNDTTPDQLSSKETAMNGKKPQSQSSQTTASVAESQAESTQPVLADTSSAAQPLQESITTAAPTVSNLRTVAMQEDQNALITEQSRRITEQSQQIQTMMQELRLERAASQLERSLAGSILPDASKQQIRTRFEGRVFESQELDREISSQLDLLAQLTSAGLIRGNGFEKQSSVTSMISEAEKVQAAFDRMFDLEPESSSLSNVRGFSSILEAYRRVTGDASLQGGISGHTSLGQIRVSENAPITRITEADVTTASFSYLLGSSMNKRLLKDYQAWPAEWQKFVSVAPIRDFKQQVRVRFGAFGSLPIVPEDTAYQSVSATDSAATYVPQKRGNLVTVSRESIINDDLQAIKQIPTKLAVAASYTLAEFVYGFFVNNSTIYDGVALFHANHSNLGSSALSSNAMQLGVTAMREQTSYAGKRIGLRPRFLIVPAELEWVAMTVTKSGGVPGSANNDINPMLGYVTPIVSPQLTSSTQWFMAGDPREIDTIEVGFVGGQVNPQLFIQDSPMLGINFTQDAITFKIRHEYGGGVVDFRGLYRGI